MSLAITLALATLPTIAAPFASPPDDVEMTPPRVALQLRFASLARAALHRPPSLTRNDCSGLVMELLARAGLEQPGDVRSYWEQAVADGRAYRGAPPAPGDLVFFDRTYDKNRNGRVDDDLSHIAIVAGTLPDGTLVLVHRGSAGITALRMNLDEPAVHARDGAVMNDYLRAPRYGPANKSRLSGELFRAFAKPPRPLEDERDDVSDPLGPSLASGALPVGLGERLPRPGLRDALDPLRAKQVRLRL